ncbi:MAG: hypothetical protein Ct9H90mP3_5700 [Flammeovirgaceae bacterium]|nr:MAG: hypothetical protein Ct9H90mP3_5700 [Flammeovirgaceae bacterium]
MILMLFYTGYDPSKEKMKFFEILENSSGSTSVLYSVILSIIIAASYYIFNGIFLLKKLCHIQLKEWEE